MARPRLERPNYRLRRNGRGVWEVHWTQDGRTRRWSCRTQDQTEAGRLRDHFIATRDLIRIDEPTVTAICDSYYQTRKAHLAMPDNLKFSLARVKDHLGNLHPSLISQATIDDYARKREGRANATIIRELKCLRAALHWSRDNLGLSAPRFRMPVPDSRPRERWLTKDEARKLIEACKAPHIEMFVRLALATGARSNAILGLTWEGVDLEAERIDFGDDVGKKRRAVVPIAGQLRQALEGAANVATTAYVVEYRGAKVGDVKKALLRTAKRAGLGQIGKHTLRHTAATWMVMEGISTAEVARYLGATETVIERVYGHWSPDYLKRAAQALEF